MDMNARFLDHNMVAKEQPDPTERVSCHLLEQESKTPGLKSNDVIMGRGSGANLKKGNVKFRQLVWDKYNDEMARMERKTMEAIAAVKIKVANDVLDQIKSNGGRFLRKTLKPVSAQHAGSGEESSVGGEVRDIVYEEVPDKEALEKIKQTLRFQIERRRDRGSRSGSWNTQDPTMFSSLVALGGAIVIPSGAPSAGNAGLLQAIDDRLLQMISQERISTLLQGHGPGTIAATGTLSILNNVAAAATAATTSTPAKAYTWPPLLSAAASAATVASKQAYHNRRSRLASGSVQNQGIPHPSNPIVALQCLPSQTMPLSPAGQCLTNPLVWWTSPTVSKALAAAPAPSLEDLSPTAANQLEMQALIRREELQLMLDRIRTHRLTNFLRQSLCQPPT
jgi:hypothetical protein